MHLNLNKQLSRIKKNLSLNINCSLHLKIEMFGLGSKSTLVLGLAIILGVWLSRKSPKERDYWKKLPRFNDVLPNFDTPQPIEQSMLFKTAEEIVDPLLAQSSGKIPKWLKGKTNTEG